MLLGFEKPREKMAKTRNLGFLRNNVYKVGEKSENQRKTREKSKVAENQVLWLVGLLS